MRELLLITAMVPFSASAQAGHDRAVAQSARVDTTAQSVPVEPRRTPTALVSSRQKDIAEAGFIFGLPIVMNYGGTARRKKGDRFKSRELG